MVLKSKLLALAEASRDAGLRGWNAQNTKEHVLIEMTMLHKLTEFKAPLLGALQWRKVTCFDGR
jgi:hypothetical protein